MFAQSRTATYENAKVSGSSYQDNADVDVSGASLARTAQLRHNPQQKDSDFDAIEAWLNENPGEGQAGAGPRQEPISSSEFDRFLAERAAAADALPTITAATAPQVSGNEQWPATTRITRCLPFSVKRFILGGRLSYWRIDLFDE
nr:target of Myb protein 1-like isoform X1 [Penaeus vannamei]